MTEEKVEGPKRMGFMSTDMGSVCSHCFRLIIVGDKYYTIKGKLKKDERKVHESCYEEYRKEE